MSKPLTIRFWVPEDAPEFVPADSRKVTIDDLTAYLVQCAKPDYGPQLDVITDDAMRKIADGIGERDYHETVTGIVDDLKRAVADGEIADRDSAIEWLEQTIDGHHDVIYTACAQNIIMQSRNDGAYFEDFGSEGAISDSGIEWSKLAYCALRADVLEQIGDLDEWFKCSECNDDVDADDLKLAGTDGLPVCASCREANEGDSDADQDADQDADTGEDK